MLRVYVPTNQKDWSSWLDVLNWLITTLHIHHTRPPWQNYSSVTSLVLLSDLLKESGLTMIDSHPDLQQCLLELQAHRDAAKDTIWKSLDKQAYHYDKGHCLLVFKIGDKVLMNPRSLELVDVKGKSCKLVQRKIGPFEITEVLGPTTYQLRLPDSYPMHNMVNVQHLTKYMYNQGSDDSRPLIANPRDELKGTEEFEVKPIVGEQRGKGKMLYRI
jgi:hypothetical protein